MTSFFLRLIAIIAMLLDHTAAVLVNPASDAYTIMRIIGRIAFPIFCFLIVEGFEHTRSVWKYMGRLAVSAVIAEVPFDLAFHRAAWDFKSGQNVFLTLLLGLIAITAAGKGAPWIIKKIAPDAKCGENRWIQLLVASPVIFGCARLADILNTDYGMFGVITVCIFYLFQSRRPTAIILFTVWNIIRYCARFELQDSVYAIVCIKTYLLNTVQWFAPLAAPLLMLYNGKPGEKKYRELFYVFYPAHLLILWVISLIIK